MRQCMIERNEVLSLFHKRAGGGCSARMRRLWSNVSSAATRSKALAGGVCCDSQDFVLDSTLSSNSAALSGGGFYIQTGGPSGPSLRAASFRRIRPAAWEAEDLFGLMGSCWTLSFQQTAPAAPRPQMPAVCFSARGEAPRTARWWGTRPLPEPAAFFSMTVTARNRDLRRALCTLTNPRIMHGPNKSAISSSIPVSRRRVSCSTAPATSRTRLSGEPPTTIICGPIRRASILAQRETIPISRAWRAQWMATLTEFLCTTWAVTNSAPTRTVTQTDSPTDGNIVTSGFSREPWRMSIPTEIP